MYINSHCHVFTYPSVYTTYAADIIEKRLAAMAGVGPPLAKAIVAIVKGVVEGTMSGVSGMSKNAVERRISSALATLNMTAVLGERLKTFLRVVLAHSIDEVTDILLQEFEEAMDRLDLDDEYVITPLMMDIVDKKTPPNELERLTTQHGNTVRQCVRYPGRVLPFFPVNTMRADHLDRMKMALSGGSCIGVKLYPSLGYTLQTQAMQQVFGYCANPANAVPLLMHCNQGGMTLDYTTTQYANPKHWNAILNTYQHLRICFGHFGGDEAFQYSNVEGTSSWTKTILGLMRDYPGRVYADVSYHDIAFSSAQRKKNYFDNLLRLLNNKSYNQYILWGTDFHMILLAVDEDKYWRFYMKELVAGGNFDQIADKNPRRFLGLDTGDAANPFAPNILRHIEFLKDKKTSIDWAKPGPVAKWVSGYVK